MRFYYIFYTISSVLCVFIVHLKYNTGLSPVDWRLDKVLSSGVR